MIKSGISDPACFKGSEALYMSGMLAALLAAGVWNITASIFGLPVSSTHGAVGAIIGMTLPLKGPSCVKWGLDGMSRIFISWVVSPALSGFISFSVLLLLRFFVIKSKNPTRNSLIATPILFGASTFFVFALVVWDSVPGPLWINIIISIMASFIVGININTFLIPYIRRKLANLQNVSVQDGISNVSYTHDETRQGEVPIPSPENQSHTEIALSQDTDTDPEKLDLLNKLDDPKPQLVFKYLQIFTACMASFAHGTNDTSNAIGPFAAIWFLWREGVIETDQPIPIWIPAMGGVAIVLGLVLLGKRVIKTMGEDITKIDFVNGFTSEVSSSIAVVVASRLKIPVSSTHCQVGAIAGVGIVGREKMSIKNVDWRVLGKIAISWVVTLPICAGIAAGISYGLSFAVRA